MASPSRGAGGRSSSRSGGRSSYSGARGGGGNSAMPAIIAGVVIVAVVGVAVVVMGKKGDTPSTPEAPPAAPAPVAAAPVGPKAPVLGPRPNLPASIVAKAKSLMPKIKTASEAGGKLREQAMAAKKTNDQDQWQSLLEEAREVYKTARDEWIEVEDELAEYLSKNPSQGWDENMLMDAFLKVESRDVQRLIDEPLSGLAKTGRGH